jgi:hypothetical protein
MKITDYFRRGFLPFYCFADDGGDGGGGGGGGGGDATTSVVNPDGTFVENWHEKFGQANKDTLSRFKTHDDLVNSHISLRKKLGKNPDALVEIPSETSSDEVKAARAKANNVPEKYEYALSDELAVKLGPLDDKKMTALRKFGKKKNWSQQDFKDVLDFYHNDLSDGIDAFGAQTTKEMAEAAEAGKAELKKLWLENYDTKVQRAQSVMEKYGGVDAVAETNLQNSPTMIKFLDNIAEAMSEDTLKGLAPSTAGTVANIDSQITDIREQMNVIVEKNPVNFKNNAKYKDLMKRKTDLYKQKSKKSA